MDAIGTIADAVKPDERQLLLFWALHTPMTVTQMADRGFLGKDGLQRESYERTFRRICEDFAENGIQLQSLSLGGETSYRVDLEATYVNGSVPTQDELLELVMLVGTYLDGTYQDERDDAGRGPYLDCLRRARDKLACTGNGAALLGGSSVPCDDASLRGYTLLLEAYVNRRGATFSYTDAGGARSKRDVDVYGVFRHDGHAFFVGFDHTRNGIRVFRDDRIDLGTAKESSRSFEVPESFCIDDYEGLPFEYGSDDHDGLFVPVSDNPRAHAVTAKSGTWNEEGWHVGVRNMKAAARWACLALENDLVAVRPAQLADMLRDGLAKVVHSHA